jgi:twinkle protein
LYLEDVTVVTGTPNAGKSNFVDWLVTVHAKRHGLKAGVFTGEKTIDIHLAGLVYKWLEKSREEMNPEKDGITFMEAMAGLHDYIFYFSESIRTFDELLDYGKVMVKRYGIDILVLDNWTVIDKSVPNLTDSKDYYGTILGKLSHFAKKNKCHVFLVVHPRKLEEINGLYKMPRGYDLYGTSHFFNIPDNGISLRAGDGYTDILVWKVRHQEFVGNPGSGKLKFLERQGRIYDNFVSPNRFKLEIEQNIIDDAPF